MCEIIDVHNFSLQTWPGAKKDEKKNGDSAPLLIDCFFLGEIPICTHFCTLQMAL